MILYSLTVIVEALMFSIGLLALGGREHKLRGCSILDQLALRPHLVELREHFIPIHAGHVEVHYNQAVRLPAALGQLLGEDLQAVDSVVGLINLQVMRLFDLLKDKLESHDVEVVIIDDKDSATRAIYNSTLNQRGKNPRCWL